MTIMYLWMLIHVDSWTDEILTEHNPNIYYWCFDCIFISLRKLLMTQHQKTWHQFTCGATHDEVLTISINLTEEIFILSIVNYCPSNGLSIICHEYG